MLEKGCDFVAVVFNGFEIIFRFKGTRREFDDEVNFNCSLFF